MTINKDLQNASDICANAADAATNKLISLGPRPNDLASAAIWDNQDSLLKNKISTLNNLSATISALIVSDALQNIWPNLTGLDKVTSSAQANIKTIADISKAMSTIASIVNFGVAVTLLSTQPTPANAASLVTAFENIG
jgi:hypothetical protein